MKRFLLIVLISCAISFTAFAQLTTPKHSYNFGFTFVDPSASPGNDVFVFDSTFSSAIRLGFNSNLSDWWELGTGLSFGLRRYFTHSEQTTERAFNTMIDARLLLKFANGRWIDKDALFQPYIGMGYNWNGVRLDKDRWNSFISNEWIGGIGWKLNSQISLRTEIAIDNRITGKYDPALRYRMSLGYIPGAITKTTSTELLETNELNKQLEIRLEEQKDSMMQVIQALRLERDSLENIKPKVVEVEKIVYVDSSEQEVTNTETTEPQASEPDIREEMPVDPPVGYYAIVASTKDLNKAEEMVADLRKSHPMSYVLPAQEGYNRVAVYSGMNQQNANQLIKELRSNGYLMAWLLFVD